MRAAATKYIKLKDSRARATVSKGQKPLKHYEALAKREDSRALLTGRRVFFPPPR